MKQTEQNRTFRLSRLFSYLILFIGLFGAQMSTAQTGKGCVVGKFDFKVDNNTVYFAAQAKGPVVAYQWNFGDGSKGTGEKARHQYAAPGTYKVCLTILGYDSVNQKRCSFDVCRAVEIKCDLKADYEFKIDGKSVKFAAKSNSKHTVYAWSFGDSDHARGQRTAHTYAKPGVYEVCLIAKDTLSGCTVRSCKKVEIKDPCATLKGEIVYKQQGNDFAFTVRTKKGNGIRTLWRFSDGDSAKGRAVRKSFDKPGVYTVCATLIQPRTKCRVTICTRVEVKDTCKLEVRMDAGVNGFDVKAKARSNSRNVVYGWTFGDGNSMRGNPAGHTYAKPGVYELCVIAYDTVTKCRVKECKRIEIRDTCDLKAEFKWRTDSSGVSYFHAFANDSNANFTWDFGDGSSASGNPVRHQYKPGKYTICMIAYTSRACVVRKCHTVVIGSSKRSGKFEIPVSDEAYGQGDENASASRIGWEWDNTHVSLAPNPVQSTAIIQSENMDIQQVAVFASDGNKLMEYAIHSGESLDFSTLPRGSYYIRILGTQGEVEHLRFFKN